MRKLLLLTGLTGLALSPAALAVPASFQYITTADATSIGLSASEALTIFWTVDTTAADLDADPSRADMG